MEETVSLNEKLNTFLFTYTITPQIATGISPLEPLINRNLKSKIIIIKPGAESSKNVFLPNSLKRVMKFEFETLALVINGY